MKISNTGVNFIKQWEGEAGGKPALKAYKDGGGVWTIGFGHTATAAAGKVVTSAQAEELLRQDLVSAEKCVNDVCYGLTITQPQYDALVSFAFNVGNEALRRSTLARRLKANDFEGAAVQFLSWVYDNGKVVKGLYNRRVAERDLFLTKPKATSVA